ncbi:glycosyltransferase [Alkalilimnicola ehrlichii]|nr:glycosyltransferase [Alkalilimnicola ehrlichii]
MRRISRNDSRRNGSRTRIYRKSWARWRRHGREGFLLRLIREYHPYLVQWLLSEDPYRIWIRTTEIPRRSDLAQIATTLDKLTNPPHIVLLLTAGDTPPTQLRATLESVCRQAYPHWTLYLDLQPAEVDSLSADYGNDRIAAHPSSDLPALPPQQAADSCYFAHLKAGDRLAKDALYYVADALRQRPGIKILYSDEDTITPEGRRLDPHFKPDWSPDLVLSYNYVGQLCLYRYDLIRSLPSSKPNDTLLYRCLPLLADTEIAHIPKVLFHRSSLSPRRPPLSTDEEQAALSVRRAYLTALGHGNAVVEPARPVGTYRVRYPVPRPQPLVSLLIPTRDRRDLLETCIRSVLGKTSYSNFEILVLDNQSKDPATLSFLSPFGERISAFTYCATITPSTIQQLITLVRKQQKATSSA